MVSTLNHRLFDNLCKVCVRNIISILVQNNGHGDLSKPSAGPNGRRQNNEKWRQLTEKLNSEGSGDPRDEEKWRKVWSDFKNNSKKKNAEIDRSMRKTGGGPAKKKWLTDFEARVIAIMGEKAATGMRNIPEAGFSETSNEDVQSADTPASPPAEIVLIEVREEHEISDIVDNQPRVQIIGDEDWNTPGCSDDPIPTREPAKRSSSTNMKWVPPRKKSKTTDSAADAFLECEKERDEKYLELEKERIRQRDRELDLQAKWQDIMEKALDLLAKYLDTNK